MSEEITLLLDPENGEAIDLGVKKPFQYFGGKAFLAKRLAPILPKHGIYVEPFAGSAALFFEKNPSKKEVLNDRDEEIARYYRITRGLTPASLASARQIADRILEKWKRKAIDANLNDDDEPEPGRGPVSWLVSFLAKRASRFGGMTGGSGHTTRRQAVGKLQSYINRLTPVRERLKGVSVHASDWKRVCEKYDSEETLFYLDPPYRSPKEGHASSAAYRVPFELEDLAYAKKLRGKVIVSYRPTAKLCRVLGKSGWSYRHIRETNSGGWTTRGGHIYSPNTQGLLATNFDLPRITYSLSQEPLALIGDESKIEPLSPSEFYSAGGEFAWKDREVSRVLEAAGDRVIVRMQREAPSLPGGFASAHNVDPMLIAKLDSTVLIALHGALHKLFDEFKTKGVENEDAVNAHAFVASEVARRGMEHRPEGTLDEVSKRFEVRSARDHVQLAELLPYFKPCALRKPYISLVGGCAVSGHGEDIDILIAAKERDEVVEFRILEMLPPPLRSRVQFIYDPRGPFTNYVPLFSHELVAIEPREVVALAAPASTELQRVKEEPPLPEDAASEIGRWKGLSREELAGIDPVNLPEGFFAFQWHFRGKSVHGDLRIKRDGFLEGYTLDTQIAGAIREDVSKVSEARALDASFDDPKVWKFRPSMNPSKKVLVQPKARQPLAWLTMVEKAVPPGTVGATREEEGVFWGVDWGLSWIGVDKPFFREVWLKGRRFDARLVLRLLKRKKETQAGSEAFFWEGWLAKADSPPTFFTANQRKKRNWVPIVGTSGLPPWWEDVIPIHLRWWPQKLDRRSVLTQMDGAFAHLKKSGVLLAHEADGELSTLELARRLNSRMHAALAANDFVLTRHYWRGPVVVRGMPVETFYLKLDRGGDSLDAFVLDDNPLLRSPVVASREAVKRPPPGRSSPRDWLRFEGDIPPGQPGNPNMELTVHVEILDRGKFAPLETRDDFVSFEARGAKLTGMWMIMRESQTSDLWVLSPAKDATRRRGPAR